MNDNDRDWPEDFSHENGNYMCRCYKCGEIFRGHKRRVMCKVCAAPPKLNFFQRLFHRRPK